MTTTKVQPPRKLTENEDNDSFDDFWFQVICYYSRDEAFKAIFEDPNYTWKAPNVEHRGLQNSTQAANLNTLLRALATYAAGPYIRTNIIETTTSLQDVRKEFMKYLEIELTDFTALEWFEIKRRPTERPLVFYMRLKYHMSKHLLKSGEMYQGTALTADESLTPSMQRFIIMEWLHRLDERLVKFVKEKFSTELSSGSTILVTMVESLARNVDHYITLLNNPTEISAVSFSNPSYSYYPETAFTDQSMVGFQSARGGGSRGNQRNFFPRRGGSTRGFRGGPPQGRGGFAPGRGRGLASRDSQRGQRDCVYCYMEYRNGNYCDYKHPISNCPKLTQMYGGINHVEIEQEEDIHPYEETVNNFYNEDEDVEYAQQ